MSKTLKLTSDSSGIRAAVLSKDIKKEIKMRAIEEETTVSAILRELIIEFNSRIETENVKDIALEFCGHDIYDSKDMKTITFRIEHDYYKKFCLYALCIGNEPTELLRKLVLQYFDMKIAQYSILDICH